jgi:hypothetical protein
MLISEMRNSQLFQDLCQQLFAAEYDDFQMVDDSYGDKGCDGYVPSRHRLFAIYCPEKSPTPIEYYRSKIRQDLNKAIRLRDEFGYKIDDWIFVTPVALAEELHRFIREISEASGINGLSWSAKQLVNLLSKHEEVCRHFPELIMPDLKRELHLGFNRLSAEFSGSISEVSRAALLNRKLETEAVKLMVDRFLSVFNNHGILTNQIPRFIDPKFNLTLSDFKNQETILHILTDELIHWTCESFGISSEWIEGSFDWTNQHTKKIYPRFECYKNIQRFIDRAVRLRRTFHYPAEMYVFKASELKRRDDVRHDSYIGMVLREVIGFIREMPIYRYIPITALWRWDYWRSRYQSKALFLICEKLEIVTHGYDVSREILDDIAEGRIFPGQALRRLLSYTWYPEDYIDLPKENVRAQEVDEVEKVRQYIQDEGYLQYLRKVTDLFNDE